MAAFLLFSVEGVGGVNPTLPHIRNPTDTHCDYSNTQNAPAAQEGTPGCAEPGMRRLHGACVLAPGGDDPRGEEGSQPQETGDRRHERGPQPQARSTRGAGLNHRQTEKAGGSREYQDGRDVAGCGRPRPQQEPPALPPQPKRCRASTPLKPQGPPPQQRRERPGAHPAPRQPPRCALPPERLQGPITRRPCAWAAPGRHGSTAHT